MIAASNRDLAADVAAGVFRQDLYYRLNVMTLTIPPLRDRTDDILLLAKHFLTHWNQKLGKNVVGFEAQVRQAFLQYDWPGNIRELDNVVYRSVALADDDGHIGLGHLLDTAVSAGHRTLTRRAPQNSLKDEMAGYEKELIIAALKENKWNVKLTAEKLNLSRVALGQKIKKYEIKRPPK
ncbi:MAG: sigma 54-interacting transcriptional regulator [Candidatus Latescibacteria bacterium]|nr:sigma 54-interacting transcriptional regulator [Candidatus Latescibacterota bacterium]MBT4136795.1 sigma 54-interacting transcriptional regulator [Candidatus Latescibacterota bacterium]